MLTTPYIIDEIWVIPVPFQSAVSDVTMTTPSLFNEGMQILLTSSRPRLVEVMTELSHNGQV